MSLHAVRLHSQTPLLFWLPHPFNGPFSGTTQVSRYQKGKTNLDFTEARDSEWQWHQLGLMQVCTLLQTDNHTSTPPLSFYRPDALPAAQPTASKHWRLITILTSYLYIPHCIYCIYSTAWKRCHLQNRKYITYHSVSRRRSSHSHSYRVQKIFL